MLLGFENEIIIIVDTNNYIATVMSTPEPAGGRSQKQK